MFQIGGTCTLNLLIPIDQKRHFCAPPSKPWRFQINPKVIVIGGVRSRTATILAWHNPASEARFVYPTVPYICHLWRWDSSIGTASKAERSGFAKKAKFTELEVWCVSLIILLQPIRSRNTTTELMTGVTDFDCSQFLLSSSLIKKIQGSIRLTGTRSGRISVTVTRPMWGDNAELCRLPTAGRN